MDKRAAKRFPADLAADCRTLDRTWTARLRNLSTSGCMMTCDEGALAERDRLRIRVKGLAAIDAQVVWRHRNHAGIRFRVPLHPAAMEHLGFELPDGAWADAFFEARRGARACTPARAPVSPAGLSGGLVKRVPHATALDG